MAVLGSLAASIRSAVFACSLGTRLGPGTGATRMLNAGLTATRLPQYGAMRKKEPIRFYSSRL
jgi:hypothetical protein